MTAYRRFSDRKRVALAGFGVVGEGVYERLAARPAQFEVVAILCRNREAAIARGAPAPLVTTDFEALPDYDILVEAIGGVSPAERFVKSALAGGADVVSSNKTLISRRFDALHDIAARTKARLRFSAAVGGGAPMLEDVETRARLIRIERLDAVLNGTTNFVLEKLGSGLDLPAAIKLAQAAGFAEADPSADIDGVDAAEKLALLARRAFNIAIDPDAIPRDRLSSVPQGAIAAAAQAGAPYKQIASARRTKDGVEAAVRLVKTPPDDPLSEPHLEENRLIVTAASGERFITDGKGAGRDPTADSVIADLFALLAAPVMARP